MGWTKNQMKDHVIDQIIKIIIKNRHNPYFYNVDYQLDLLDFKKTVSDSGYIQTTGDETKKQVIFQEDYQKSKEVVDTFINQHLDCFQSFEGGTPKIDEFGQFVYDEPLIDWVDNDDNTQGGVWNFDVASFDTHPCYECDLLYCSEAPHIECQSDDVCTNGTCTEPSNIGGGLCAPSCTDDWGNQIYGPIRTNDLAYIRGEFTCPNGNSNQSFILEVVTPASDTFSLATGTPVLDYNLTYNDMYNITSTLNENNFELNLKCERIHMFLDIIKYNHSKLITKVSAYIHDPDNNFKKRINTRQDCTYKEYQFNINVPNNCNYYRDIKAIIPIITFI